MNIVIISAVFPPEPVVSANLSSDLAIALSGNHNVTVFSPKPTRPMGYDFSETPIIKHPFKHVTSSSYTHPESSLVGRFRESYSFGKACAKYIEEHHTEIDIIYINTWPLLAQYFTVKTVKKRKLPIVLHVQDIYPESLANKLPFIGPLLNYLFRPMDAWILQNSVKVITISNKMKDYLISTRKLQPSSVGVINNWQDETEFLKLNVLKGGSEVRRPFTFMYLGNIGPVAGCDLLINSFASLKEENCKLVIAGSGSVKRILMEKARQLNIKNIEFLSVPDGNVPQTQAMADVLLLPIKKGAAASSIPSKLPAYMFSAKPIIAAVDYDSDTAESIRNASCGWIVEPENVEALKVVMQMALNLSAEELRNLGLKGRSYGLKHFSKKSNMPRLVNIIEDLIER